MIGWRRIVQLKSLSSAPRDFLMLDQKSRRLTPHNTSLTLIKRGIQIINYSADIIPRQITDNFNYLNSNNSSNETASSISEICLALSPY